MTRQVWLCVLVALMAGCATGGASGTTPVARRASAPPAPGDRIGTFGAGPVDTASVARASAFAVVPDAAPVSAPVSATAPASGPASGPASAPGGSTSGHHVDTDAAGAAVPSTLLTALPPEHEVREALLAQPSYQAAWAAVEQARAQQRRLEVGPHEWIARGGVQRRRVTPDAQTYREPSVGLERSLRWFGKSTVDRQLGQALDDAARRGVEDGWHEAGRTFLGEWFDAVRTQRAVARLREQRDLANRLVTIVDRRIRVGDAPRVEGTLARGELARSETLLRQAGRQAELARLTLERGYPGLRTLPGGDASPGVDEGHRASSAPLPAPITLDDGRDWVAIQLADNHEIELAQAQARAAALRAERARRDRVPDPTIGVAAAREFGGAEKLLSLNVGVPLPGAGRQADYRAALAESEGYEARLRATERRVSTAAARTVASARSAFALWQSQRETEELQLRNAASLERAYQLGEGSLNDVLTARRLAVDAALAAETAQVDALEAQLRLMLDAHRLWRLELDHHDDLQRTDVPDVPDMQ